jgi:hypothetical protein
MDWKRGCAFCQWSPIGWSMLDERIRWYARRQWIREFADLSLHMVMAVANAGEHDMAMNIVCVHDLNRAYDMITTFYEFTGDPKYKLCLDEMKQSWWAFDRAHDEII